MAASKHGPIYCHEVCNTKRTGCVECRLVVKDVAPDPQTNAGQGDAVADLFGNPVRSYLWKSP